MTQCPACGVILRGVPARGARAPWGLGGGRAPWGLAPWGPISLGGRGKGAEGRRPSTLGAQGKGAEHPGGPRGGCRAHWGPKGGGAEHPGGPRKGG
ncbi:hypothetical protein QE152_g7672 [Popillia japonica]|uniref:Uncharacterized protein n=1 Tax=Popillia japonica TaxID=7064 RepID=A0AAW1ME63_POPJA